MSYQEIENLSKADLKNKLSQMGMSLDRNDHPRDYYAQMYIEKSNAKNKITRDNTPFYKEQMLGEKRERQKEIDKELLEDPNYEQEEIEEEEEEILDENEPNEESEEKQEKEQKEKKVKFSSIKKSARKEIDEKNNDYRESGIKITRLIRKRKARLPKTKKILFQAEEINSGKKISNNNEEMAGQNGQNSSDYLVNDNNSGNAQEPKINNDLSYQDKNNGFYENQNKPEIKNDAITLKVENISNDNNKGNERLNMESKEYKKVYYGKSNEPKQNSEAEVKNTNFVSFGAPKNNTEIHFLSKGPVSFGVNQNSTNVNNKDKNNSQTKKYNFFIKNISESIKEDIKENQNKPKTILLKWDTPKQKEFLSSSMAKEQTFKRVDQNVNDENKVNLQYKFEENEKAYPEIPKNQIVNDSIQNTTINQYDNVNMNNDNPYNDYKSKLRSYKRVLADNPNPEQLDKNDANQKSYKNSKNKSPNQLKNDININTSDFNNNINYQNKDNNLSSNNNDNYQSVMEQNNLNNYNEPNNNHENEDIEMKDSNNMNNMKYFTNEGNNNMDNQYNIDNQYNMNDNNNQNIMLDSMIKSNNQNFEQNEINDNSNINTVSQEKICLTGNPEKNNEVDESEIGFSVNKQTGSNSRKSILKRFRNSVYMWPLIILICLGIVLFLNERYKQFDDRSILIYSFSVIIGLIIFYNIIKYVVEKRKYKKMAKEDKKKLLELLEEYKISREEFGKNLILVNKFIYSRIQYHNISEEEYINYVFPYLEKYLEKDKYKIMKEENEENICQYWKEI